MIRLIIEDADIEEYRPGEWIVTHPNNDAILAYCDTEAEANAVRKFINSGPTNLRCKGYDVR